VSHRISDAISRRICADQKCKEIVPGGRVARVEREDDPESTTYGVEVAGVMSEVISIAGSSKFTDGWCGNMDVPNLDSPVRTTPTRAVVNVDACPAVDVTKYSPLIEEAAAVSVVLESPPARQGLVSSLQETAMAQRKGTEPGSVSRIQAEYDEEPPWSHSRNGDFCRRWKSEDGLRPRVVWQTAPPDRHRIDLGQLLQHRATGGHLDIMKTCEQMETPHNWKIDGMGHEPTLKAILRLVFDRGKSAAAACVRGG
jgi:hypothetical protein